MKNIVQWEKIAISVLFFLFVLQISSYSKNDSNLCQDKESTGIIDADNPNIQFVGRFDRSNPKKAVFDWPGVYIRAIFEGTSCSIRLNDGNNFYNITIDSLTPLVLKTDNSNVYSVATDLKDTVHTILIEKRTEANIGKGEFLGFILDKGKQLFKIGSTPNRRIEFIGNSITCGYGVEGTDVNEHFRPETENATKSFAALIGRALDADYSMIAYSGKGVVRNYGDSNKTSMDPMPSLYNRICCYDSTLDWDYSSWVPQVVVINLGTNDYSTKPYPDKTVFEDGYIKLIDKVQSQYSDVSIFCICGPMINQLYCSYVTEVVNQYQHSYTNNKVYFVEVNSGILTSSDWGSNWHPNASGQQKTADIILPIIKAKMGW